MFLFHGSVRDNIAYGRPDATDEAIEEAARLAEAHDFVLELPEGYATVVGERGVKLSGGQRQRLSIARAILRDPAVLLLDEATSAVDNETEAAIQRSLARVGEGRTVVVIAHRLSTVRDADRIWVLEAGGVAEAGTHDELVAADGLYAALWRVQTGDAVHRVNTPARLAFRPAPPALVSQTRDAGIQAGPTTSAAPGRRTRACSPDRPVDGGVAVLHRQLELLVELQATVHAVGPPLQRSVSGDVRHAHGQPPNVSTSGQARQVHERRARRLGSLPTGDFDPRKAGLEPRA